MPTNCHLLALPGTRDVLGSVRSGAGAHLSTASCRPRRRTACRTEGSSSTCRTDGRRSSSLPRRQ